MNTVLHRVTRNWTFARVVYTLFGVIIIVHAIGDQKYFGLIPGLYFASMGIFAFGCASGNCYGGSCSTNTKED